MKIYGVVSTLNTMCNTCTIDTHFQQAVFFKSWKMKIVAQNKSKNLWRVHQLKHQSILYIYATNVAITLESRWRYSRAFITVESVYMHIIINFFWMLELLWYSTEYAQFVSNGSTGLRQWLRKQHTQQPLTELWHFTQGVEKPTDHVIITWWSHDTRILTSQACLEWLDRGSWNGLGFGPTPFWMLAIGGICTVITLSPSGLIASPTDTTTPPLILNLGCQRQHDRRDFMHRYWPGHRQLVVSLGPPESRLHYSQPH